MSTTASNATVGQELDPITQIATIETGKLYAEASNDHNPLHQDPEVAASISPTGGVIAHGMFSMGLASRLLTAFAGGPDQVASIQVRFSKPWPVDTTSTFGGTVTAVTDDTIEVDLWGRNDVSEQMILKGSGSVRR
ncbi:MAG: acyl dehydratase [Glaciecola sp.]|jgi:acyl dehydratase